MAMNHHPLLAVLLNLLLPGCGLILARREWLGFVIALFFTVCGQIAIFGLWNAPQSVATPVTALALGFAVALWVGAQMLLRRQLRIVADPNAAVQINTCHHLADEAVASGRLEDAYGALCVAKTVDDEDLSTHVRLARVATLLGRYDEARQIWRKVEQLDRKQEFRRELVQALERLPDQTDK